jgi:hypothetical protein
MRTQAWVISLALAAGMGQAAPRPALADAADEEIRDRLEVLTEEVRDLREQLAIPATDEELESRHGLGPAASRVYGGNAGLSIGGYGEFHFAQPTGDASDRRADFLRFITYFGYKFSESIVMNTEIEFEHATTSPNFEGRAGEVSVEFGYVDFLLDEAASVRAGTVLLPMGFVNRIHEPPFFHGNVRPEVETRLIPTTWRELGVGLHGESASRARYEAYVVNGFDAMRFTANGVRDGRQKGNRPIWEDVGGVVALDVTAAPGLRLGGSGYYGEADQNRDFDGGEVSATVRIAEAHAELRSGRFEARGLLAGVALGDAGALSAELGDVIPEAQRGWYVECAYDVAPWLGLRPSTRLLAWGRREQWNLHHEVPTGLAADPAREGAATTLGLELFPHPSVVVKADVTLEERESGDETADPLRVGVGFVF